MNAPLFDDLIDQLRGEPTRRLAQAIDLPPQATAQAVATVLPMLLGAMQRNAQGVAGAQTLLAALDLDHRGVDPVNALTNSIAGGAYGEGVLGHLFGARQPLAADAVGEATGLDRARGATLLHVLAPVVMAYLARRVFTSNQIAGATAPQASPDGLRAALDTEVATLRERGNLHPTLLALLDRDDDGDVDIHDFTGDRGSPLSTQTAEMRSPRPRI